MKSIVKRFSDGSRAKICPDGSWFFTLANNKKLHGQETDEAAALAVIEKHYVDFVMACWMNGRHTREGFLVPIRR